MLVAYPAANRAEFASDPSTRNCTGVSTPRAMSRPKCAGMMSTARAALEASAASGFRSTGQDTTRSEIEVRKASMSRRDAGELSLSCTTTGRLATRSDRAALISNSNTTGSTRASASVRQSRVIWISSFRVWARTRVTGRFSAPSGGPTARSGLLDDGDEHVLQREARLASVEHADAMLLELARDGASRHVDIAVADDVQPRAE